MKSKTLAIFGIITYIFQVLSSAEDLEGNFTAPTILIAVSAIATIIFTILATIRLWRTQKVTSVLLLTSSVITLVYASVPVKIIHFLVFIWTISLIWVMTKYEKPADPSTSDTH